MVQNSLGSTPITCIVVLVDPVTGERRSPAFVCMRCELIHNEFAQRWQRLTLMPHLDLSIYADHFNFAEKAGESSQGGYTLLNIAH